MVIYCVTWIHSNDLTKGKGRCLEPVTGFTVICRNSSDALACLEYHFRNKYKGSDIFDIEDGKVELQRCKVDSRNFHANYMMMDGIREPLELNNLKDNLLRVHKIF